MEIPNEVPCVQGGIDALGGRVGYLLRQS